MGALKDVLNLPGALSASRIPLAAVFVLVAREPKLATAILCVAAATDIADGYVARRWKQSSRAGGALDALADKVFVLVVAITLAMQGTLTLIEVLLLGIRDFSEVLLFLRLAILHRRHPPDDANVFGKLTTMFQFAAVLTALLAPSHHHVFVLVAAVFGCIAAVSYVKREIHRTRSMR